MNYFENFNTDNFVNDLLENGISKLPSIKNLRNFSNLRKEAIEELNDKTFKSNLTSHRKILDLMNFNQIIFPELLKIVKLKFKYLESNNSYHIARFIKPGQVSESYRGHFDSHTFTMVIPILIPDDKNIKERGQLICFPNFRSHPKNELINIAQKIYYKKYLGKNSINKLAKKKKCFELTFDDYKPVIFFGTKTFHLNKELSKENSTSRLTFLSHYFDTSSKFGIGNIMRIIRKR